MACRELAGSQDALTNLNLQARASARWDGGLFAPQPESSSWVDAFRTADDEIVQLDHKYEYNELQGADLGNTLVPEEEVAFKHANEDLEDEKIEKIMRRDVGASYPRGPHLKVFAGQQLRGAEQGSPLPLHSSLQRQGLRLAVPGGSSRQHGIQSLVVDLCTPDSPYCGPTRPDVDGFKADVVLTGLFCLCVYPCVCICVCGRLYVCVSVFGWEFASMHVCARICV